MRGSVKVEETEEWERGGTNLDPRRVGSLSDHSLGELVVESRELRLGLICELLSIFGFPLDVDQRADLLRNERREKKRGQFGWRLFPSLYLLLLGIRRLR